MGLEINIEYENNSDQCEISESLHNFIFEKKYGYCNYKNLRKIKDYYLTDAEFSDQSLNDLIKEIEIIISQKNKSDLKELIDIYHKLTKNKIKKVRFTGD